MNEDQEQPVRHVIGENAYTLFETDATVDSAEDTAIGDQMFLEIIKRLENNQQRCIAMGLYLGFNTVEVGYMLGISKQWVSMIRQKMKEQLTDLHPQSDRTI